MINRLKDILESPVFLKEMRIGFREKKIFFTLIAWVLIIAFITSMTCFTALSEHQNIEQLPETGRVLMEVLFWAQAGLLMMLSPSLTTSSVAGEREQNCIDMLQTTHLSPSEVIFGKLSFAVSFLSLTLCSTIPLESLVFLLGGVSLRYFLFSKITLFMYGVLCSAFGLMLSARETRSAYATGQSYFCLLFLSWFVGFGVALTRYEDNTPFYVILLLISFYLYLTSVFFWKAVNFFEERARSLKILLSLGIVFYCLVVAGFLYKLWDPYAVNFDQVVWIGAGPVHFFLFGILLNPIRLKRRVERERFAQSILSKPMFWTVFLSAGLLLPLLFLSPNPPRNSITPICLYALGSGVAIAWFARGLALSKPQRYPVYLGILWGALNIIPIFFSQRAWVDSSNPVSVGHISPFFTYLGYIDKSPTVFPLLAGTFYACLLLAAGALHWKFRSKKKRS